MSLVGDRIRNEPSRGVTTVEQRRRGQQNTFAREPALFVTGERNAVEAGPGERTVRRDGSGIRGNTAVRVAALLAAASLVLTACSPGGTEPASRSSGASADTSASDSAGVQSGSKALSFTASTLTGTRLDVSTLAGSPVVLWFWAPWCTICRAEAPDVAKVAADLDGRVRFLGVPGIGREPDMRAFVEDTGTGGFVHVVDSDGSLWQRFGVISQPAFAFVASDGSVQVFAGALGGDALRERAESLVVKG